MFLLCSRVRFDELSAVQANKFQCNVLKTILQLEATFFELAEEEKKNTLVICDRGAMDPAACESVNSKWELSMHAEKGFEGHVL